MARACLAVAIIVISLAAPASPALGAEGDAPPSKEPTEASTSAQGPSLLLEPTVTLGIGGTEADDDTNMAFGVGISLIVHEHSWLWGTVGFSTLYHTYETEWTRAEATTTDPLEVPLDMRLYGSVVHLGQLLRVPLGYRDGVMYSSANLGIGGGLILGGATFVSGLAHDEDSEYPYTLTDLPRTLVWGQLVVELGFTVGPLTVAYRIAWAPALTVTSHGPQCTEVAGTGELSTSTPSMVCGLTDGPTGTWTIPLWHQGVSLGFAFGL